MDMGWGVGVQLPPPQKNEEIEMKMFMGWLKKRDLLDLPL